MQYIDHDTIEVYAATRPAHWRDIPVTSEQPSPDHAPLLEDIPEPPYRQHVGWEYVEPVVEPPQSITMRQLIVGLAMEGWITWPEAEAWADRSALPAAVTDVIDAMPAEERPAARITARIMSAAERDNALLIGAAMAAQPEATEAEIHSLLAESFTRWSKL
ncbi:MAG: hypothetical protein EA385_14100 [Salinarimonadaceae bacterium]|nr:MAG: hypothetical protein EA385_14100 [Salinarimonadaceae bacterium]